MIRNKLTVYLADDHNVVRKGMTRLLTTFNRVNNVKEAINGKMLIQLVREQEPDAVILDVEMPELGGMEAASYLIDHYPSVKILILTMHTEEGFVTRLMDLGVHGFLSKSSEPEELEKALYSIVDNDFYKNDLVIKAMQNLRKQSYPSHEKLSNREMEILTLICQEFTPGEISERLNISEKTFFNHRANIIAKTGVKNNIGLYKYALQRGYCAD